MKISRTLIISGIIFALAVRIGYTDLQVDSSSENIIDHTIQSPCPGRITKDWTSEPPTELFNYSWPYRKNTYEILALSRQTLARMIYGLAIYIGDVGSDMSLERFERGTMGWHYSIDQILKWANAIQTGSEKFKSHGEILFINTLVEDGVLIFINGVWQSNGKISHLIGAAPGKIRSIELNLTHEMMHVYWDEHPNFKQNVIHQWQSLSDSEKVHFRNSLKGYNTTKIDLIIKEWGIRKYENNPPWK